MVYKSVYDPSGPSLWKDVDADDIPSLIVKCTGMEVGDLGNPMRAKEFALHDWHGNVHGTSFPGEFIVLPTGEFEQLQGMSEDECNKFWSQTTEEYMAEQERLLKGEETERPKLDSDKITEGERWVVGFTVSEELPSGYTFAPMWEPVKPDEETGKQSLMYVVIK